MVKEERTARIRERLTSRAPLMCRQDHKERKERWASKAHSRMTTEDLPDKEERERYTTRAPSSETTEDLPDRENKLAFEC